MTMNAGDVEARVQRLLLESDPDGWCKLSRSAERATKFKWLSATGMVAHSGARGRVGNRLIVLTTCGKVLFAFATSTSPAARSWETLVNSKLNVLRCESCHDEIKMLRSPAFKRLCRIAKKTIRERP